MKESKETIKSNQWMQAEEQASFEVGKMVSNELIICQEAQSRDTDEAQIDQVQVEILRKKCGKKCFLSR